MWSLVLKKEDGREPGDTGGLRKDKKIHPAPSLGGASPADTLILSVRPSGRLTSRTVRDSMCLQLVMAETQT